MFWIISYNEFMSLNVGHLEAIVQTAKYGSFTRAAEVLYLSQPALSHRVAEAERLLKADIFDRSRRAISITPLGKEIVQAAEQVVSAFGLGIERIYMTASRALRTVNVAAMPSLAAVVLPHVLRELSRRHPEIDCRVTVAHAQEVIELTHSGACDFGIATPEKSDSLVKSEVLYRDSFFALLPQGHQLMHGETVAWADLVHERFVLPPTTSSLHGVLAKAFSAQGDFPADTLVGGEISVTAGLVAAGLGVAVTPGLAIPLTRFANVVVKPLTGPVVCRDIQSMIPLGYQLRPAAQVVHGAIKDYFANQSENNVAPGTP